MVQTENPIPVGTNQQELDFAETVLATIQAVMPQSVDNVYGYTEAPAVTPATTTTRFFQGQPIEIEVPAFETGE